MCTFSILKYGKTGRKNSLGQPIYDYAEMSSFDGWIDLLGGEETINQKAISSETTHIILTFDTDIELDKADRVKFGKKVYEVTYIDNPMELNDHLEIFLKQVA